MRSLNLMRVGLLTLVASTATMTSAHATGSFLCETSDKSLKFSAEAMVSHGLGEQFTNFKGTLGSVIPDTPPDFASTELDGTHLVHHWFYGKSLRLHVYRERPGDGLHGYMELVVDAKQSARNEAEFNGTYELTVYYMPTLNALEAKTLKAKGKVSCSVG